ncbi:MAG: alanine--tRNA ligase [bacterium]
MNSGKIRQTFLGFFKDRDHSIVRSAPIYPTDDPSLLFTNAGMNQFKEIFLGTNPEKLRRAANLQKCMRVSGKHNDLEEVGRDTSHHTFFEMMGSWSFGDYYKKEAIVWAWELLTNVWGMDKSRLYATVFKDDKEAEEIWKNETDIEHSHISRFDKKDNFWEMGETGPCGPCSEIHYNLNAEDKKSRPMPNSGDGRVIEIWNLVFIQYNRKADGSLEDLASKFVDTGAGFERITAVLQGKKSNYLTDLFSPIIKRIEEISGIAYNDNEESMPFRVIADHARALAFAISDNVIPSNEGRGYVMRRILRRAYRYGRKMDIHQPFIYKVIESVIDNYCEFYPELGSRRDFIINMVKSEEEQFEKTLDTGLERIRKAINELRGKNKNTISGRDVFVLYDTYGFPADLTRLIAQENGVGVNEDEFLEEMNMQKQRSRQGAKFKDKSLIDTSKWNVLTRGGNSEFIGYEKLSSTVKVREYNQEKERISCTLDKTPFYAESGGQVSDKGTIKGPGCEIAVDSVVKQGDAIIHKGTLQGKLPADGALSGYVDAGMRLDTSKNHTATHLVHSAMRKILGGHVKQAGSAVRPDSFRFDFNHFKALSQEELFAVEEQVNSWIMQNKRVKTEEMSFDEAGNRGALAFFGEKYGNRVRVVGIEDTSAELCGGTHVNATGELGAFVILSESSIASGVRRIEAITGEAALMHLAKERRALQSVKNMVEANNKPVLQRLEEILQEKKETESQLKRYKQEYFSKYAKELLSESEKIGGTDVSVKNIENLDKRDLTLLAEKVQDGCTGAAVLFGNQEDKGFMVICAGKQGLENKFHAGKLINKLAGVLGGKGGGKPERAQAGFPFIKDPAGIRGIIIKELKEIFK